MEVFFYWFEVYRVFLGLGLLLCDIVVFVVLCVGNFI